MVGKAHVNWPKTYRLVASRLPTIDLFEDVAPSEDWDALNEIEGLTSARLKQVLTIPLNRRVSGPGATVVMAPFAYCSRRRPMRFSDGSFGVYYAGREFETALKEVT